MLQLFCLYFLFCGINSFFASDRLQINRMKLDQFAIVPNEIQKEIFKGVFDRKKFDTMRTLHDIDLLMIDMNHILLVNKMFNKNLNDFLDQPLDSSGVTLKRIFHLKKHSIVIEAMKDSFFFKSYMGQPDEMGNAFVRYIFEEGLSKSTPFNAYLKLLIKYHLCDVNILIEKGEISHGSEREDVKYGNVKLQGGSFLSLAMQIRDDALITLLLKSHANPNIQDNAGNTLFMKYLQNNNDVKVISEFTKYTDVNIKNSMGETALSIAYKQCPFWLFSNYDSTMVKLVANKSSLENRITNFFTKKNMIITFGSYPALLGFVSLTSLIAPVLIPWKLYTGRWSQWEIYSSSKKWKECWDPLAVKERMRSLTRKSGYPN